MLFESMTKTQDIDVIEETLHWATKEYKEEMMKLIDKNVFEGMKHLDLISFFIQIQEKNL